MSQDILFVLSKVIGPFADPRTALFAALLAAVGLSWTRRWRIGRALASLTILACIGLNAAPVGPIAVQWIENLVPPPVQMPAKIDGIVVLGGDVNNRLLRSRPVSPGRDATRLIALADLSRRYPDAKLIFAGGSGNVVDRTDTDADGARRLLPLLGVDPARVIFEDKSRNTYENAVFSLEIAKPSLDETWLLVTSATHMPRSVATFRSAGWRVVPFPVGYISLPDSSSHWEIPLTFDGRIGSLGIAIREIAGYLYYFATGRIDTLWPQY